MLVLMADANAKDGEGSKEELQGPENTKQWWGGWRVEDDEEE